ncbi:MAG: VWA domain-containing protein, partial [Leptospira sp.]|nr:VWA domain-containing protein [Leptospira sp.]
SPKSYILSNLILDIEKIDTSNFPNIHVMFQLKNRRGQSLPGLKRKDFEFIENRNDKKFFDLTDMKKFNRRITASMVYENSENLNQELGKINSWMDVFFSKLTYDDRIETIRSGLSATKILPYSVSKNEIFFAMRNSKPENNINSGKAIYQAINNLSKELGPRAVIYFASGKEPLFTKQFSLQKITQFAKANGIQIYPVLAHKNSDDDSWQSLAEESGGRVFHFNDSSEELLKSIQSNLDNRYVLSYKTEVKDTISDRWIPLRLEATFRNFGGTTTGGYFVPTK